jgi:TatD DNase family protein
VGLHPWHIGPYVREDLEKVEKLSRLKNAIAIGETGLDRLAQVSFTKQMEAFDFHFSLAQKIKKPIIIHCVKAYYDFIPFAKKSQVPILFHGFNGSEDVLKKLSQWPWVYFSLGRSLFFPKGKSLWSQIPENQKLLETDNDTVSISALYQWVANLENCSLDSFSEKMKKNTFSFFGFEEGR